MFGFLGTSFAGLGHRLGILNPISITNQSILEGSANGSAVGTASLPAGYTGTASWSLTDTSGTFQINSTTGAITVLDNTLLVYATHPAFPITVSVSGVVPSVPSDATAILVLSSAAFLLLRDGTSHLLLRDGASKLVLGH